MSSSASKLPDDDSAPAAVPEQATEREQRLSGSFEDPALDEMIPGFVQNPASHPPAEEPVPEVAAAPASVVHEAVDAVQELLAEQAANSNPAILMMVPPEERPAPREETMIAMDAVVEEVQATGLFAVARFEMAEKLFQLVACEKSFPDLVDGLLHVIMQATAARAGSILEVDQEQQNYFFRSAVGDGDPEKLKAFRVPLNKGIAGHVGEHRRPLLLRDLSEDTMQMKAISMSVGLDTKTCMAAPLIVGGQLYGVVELFNRLDGGLFEEKDLAVLEDGARMAAKVLEVRFLMAELLRRAG